MDPNQLHPDSLKPNVPEPVFPPSQTPNEIEKTKKLSKRILIIVFAVLIVLVPASLFAYSKLKPAEYKSVSLATPTPAPTPTPDPTADWLTYNSNIYSIKYPPNWKAEEDIQALKMSFFDPSATATRSGLSGIITYPVSYVDIRAYPSNLTVGEYIDQNFESAGYGGNTPQRKAISVNGLQGEILAQISEGSFGYDVVLSNGEYVVLLNTQNAEQDWDQDVRSVIESFRFIQRPSDPPPATNSADQTFCTQEAMLCPDGVTYVGREGPNCEFAPCP